MPIYEYRCDVCGHDLEVIQKFSDAPLTDCPSCGKSSLRKQISVAAFHLKGTGWYKTDFKGNGASKRAGDKADASADKDDKPASKEGKASADKASPSESKRSESTPGSSAS